MSMQSNNIITNKELIERGGAVAGIEFGSTRIKAAMIAPDGTPLALGFHQWENKLVDGIWTYDLEDAWTGLAECYANLTASCKQNWGAEIHNLAAVGISGMMHGYIALDKDDQLLVPFRTWRNNVTSEASALLTELFDFPIPQRWSIAHLYQSILNGEEHVSNIHRITTLSSYVHYVLTGKAVIGVGEASGMFPVDPATGDYYTSMLEKFDKAVHSREIPWRLREILPAIMPEGEEAGVLGPSGVKLLDRSGTLKPGVPFCPPEGDAGTGMVATNSIRPRTGNVSAGTSVFAMFVLEKPLSSVYPEIDIVLTPDGKPVAMAHSNNCTSDLDAWMGLFHDVAVHLGCDIPIGKVYEILLPKALEGDPDAGGLLTIPYVSGEHLTGFTQGRPLFVRDPSGEFTPANVIRAHLFSSLGAMRTGLDILKERDGVTVDEISGHGGFFKVKGVGDKIMAAATGVPVRIQETAGEGGSWGMAVLAGHMMDRRTNQNRTLADYLDMIFSGTKAVVTQPDRQDVTGFNSFFKRYRQGLKIEQAAVDALSP